jgi:hypothetical protein
MWLRLTTLLTARRSRPPNVRFPPIADIAPRDEHSLATV